MAKVTSVIRNGLLTGVCLGLLAGCSWLESWPPSKVQSAQKEPVKAETASKVVQVPGGTWIENDAQHDVRQGDVIKQAANHQRPKGLNIDADAAQRIALLEAEVENLRNELKTMLPAVAKLASAQGSLQSALSNIQPASGSMMPSGLDTAPNAMPEALYDDSTVGASLSQEQPQPDHQSAIAPPQASGLKAQGKRMAPGETLPAVNAAATIPPRVAPSVDVYEQQERERRAAVQAASVKPAAGTETTSVAPVSAGGVFVRNIRIGEHADKTRLVLDTSDQVTFRYDVDNNEKILLIEMPYTGWRGDKSMDIANSPSIASYNVIPDNKGGHQIVMQLKQPSEVLWAQALMPGGPQGHRIVIDIAPKL